MRAYIYIYKIVSHNNKDLLAVVVHKKRKKLDDKKSNTISRLIPSSDAGTLNLLENRPRDPGLVHTTPGS